MNQTRVHVFIEIPGLVFCVVKWQVFPVDACIIGCWDFDDPSEGYGAVRDNRFGNLAQMISRDQLGRRENIYAVSRTVKPMPKGHASFVNTLKTIVE
jgi:hypothetical protein